MKRAPDLRLLLRVFGYAGYKFSYKERSVFSTQYFPAINLEQSRALMRLEVGPLACVCS